MKHVSFHGNVLGIWSNTNLSADFLKITMQTEALPDKPDDTSYLWHFRSFRHCRQRTEMSSL